MLLNCADEYKKRIAKDPVKCENQIPTGIYGFDLLSCIVDVQRFKDPKKVPRLLFKKGINSGTLNLFIGRPQGGKSTLISQVSYGMKKEQERHLDVTKEGYIPITVDDIEKDIDIRVRYAEQLKINIEELPDQMVLVNKDTDNAGKVFYDLFKLSNDVMDSCKKGSGYFSLFGKDYNDEIVYKDAYGSAIFIVDSISSLNTAKMIENVEKVKDDDLSSGYKNTDGATGANSIKRGLNATSQVMHSSNTTFLAVAHVKDKNVLGGYDTKQAQIPGLSYKEYVLGGTSLLFQANKIVMLNSYGSDYMLKDYVGMGVTLISKLRFPKIRGNDNKRIFPLVMTGKFFNSDISTYIWMSDKNYGKNYIAKNGSRSTMTHASVTHPDIAFYKDDLNDGKITEEMFNKIVESLTIDTRKIPELSDIEDYKITKANFVKLLKDPVFKKKWDIYCDAIMKIETIKYKML